MFPKSNRKYVQGDMMSHRKWGETKQQSSTNRSGNRINCCLVSLHFLCDILSGRPVHSFIHSTAYLCISTNTIFVAFQCSKNSFSEQKSNIRKIISSDNDVAASSSGTRVKHVVPYLDAPVQTSPDTGLAC